MKGTLGWLGWIVAAVIAAGAWNLHRIEVVTDDLAPPGQAASPCRPMRAAASEAEDGAGNEVVITMLRRVGELESELGRERDGRARCMAGLEKAVDRLNAQSQALSLRSRELASSRREARTTTRRSRKKGSSVKVRQPWVSVGGGEVLVEGTLYNGASEAVAGYLEIILVRDGVDHDRQTLTLELGARAETSYQTTFAPVALGRRYAVRTEWGGL